MAKPSDQVQEEGDDWLDSYLPYHLYRASSLMNMRLQRQLRDVGVNLSQWRVLSVLQAYGRCNLSRIIDLTLLEQPTVSRVVAGLEKDGMVERRVSADDSRVVEVGLRREGMEVIQKIQPVAVRRQRAALAGLSDAELATFRDVLLRIEDNIARDL